MRPLLFTGFLPLIFAILNKLNIYYQLVISYQGLSSPQHAHPDRLLGVRGACLRSAVAPQAVPGDQQGPGMLPLDSQGRKGVSPKEMAKTALTACAPAGSARLVPSLPGLDQLPLQRSHVPPLT